MVQSTDQAGVPNRKRMKRAIRHDNGAIDAAWLVGMLGEYADGEVESRIRRPLAITGAGGHRCAARGRGIAQRFEDWFARTR